MMTSEMIGRKIKDARQKAGMTQQNLADLLNLGYSQIISNWERGINMPSVDVWEELKSKLNISTGENLLKERGDKLDIPMFECIDNIKDIQKYIDEIIDNVKVDSVFELSIKRILKDVLVLSIGYHCYYNERANDRLGSINNTTWSDIGRLASLLIKSDIISGIYPLNYDKPLTGSPMKSRIEDMEISIGGQLFTDEENGVSIDGYVEALASAAEYAGRELKYIIPDDENSFTAVLNVSILSLSELLYDLDPFNWIDEEEILEELYSEQKRAIDDCSV